MKDYSSFVSCTPSCSLTTISETSIMGFYYLSICVAIKLRFINRLAVYMSNLLYGFGSVLLQKLKIKSKREIFSSRGHCLIFIHLVEIIFSLCLSFWKLGKRKEFFQLFWDLFFSVSSIILESQLCEYSLNSKWVVCTLMLNISRSWCSKAQWTENITLRNNCSGLCRGCLFCFFNNLAN